MAPQIVRVDPLAPDARLLREAARVLRGGGLVAFPTETFYGLGAAALDRVAVRRVFEIKGRPASMPLLVLVDDAARLRDLVTDVPQRAQTLMERHWPGPLTLVFRAAAHLPNELTAGTGTVGVRVPSHRVPRAIVTQLNAAITAPSANRTGAAPPTAADTVLAYFGDAIDLVLDAGPTAGGEPSTVVDVTVDPPRVLRHGAITLGSS